MNCGVVAKILGVGHCGSCHDDDAYGYEMSWIEVRGKEVDVCCEVSRTWDERRARPERKAKR